jgi:hypothetical protein
MPVKAKSAEETPDGERERDGGQDGEEDERCGERAVRAPARRNSSGRFS